MHTSPLLLNIIDFHWFSLFFFQVSWAGLGGPGSRKFRALSRPVAPCGDRLGALKERNDAMLRGGLGVQVIGGLDSLRL